MENINSIVVTGNVVHDIGEKDYGFVGSGEKATAKLSVTIAVNKSIKKNGEYVTEPAFFEVVMWGKLAETMKTFLCKGKGIGVQGRLDQDRWEKDGQKKSKIYITADKVQLLGGKGKSENESANATSDFPEDIEF